MERELQRLPLELPTGYYLERDPDLLILRRLDGAMVGAFSARGVAPEAVRKTIEKGSEAPPAEQDTPTVDAAQSTTTTTTTTTTATLRVRFFGHFEILCDEELITLGRNGKALTILKYLLAHRSRPVSQDHLMGWLWPHSNLKKARWSLNSAIHGLRKLLSECGGGSSSSSGGSSSSSGGGGSGSANPYVVVLEEGYYRLCSEVQILSDVDEFDHYYEEGRRLRTQGSLEQAAAHYESAISLYRGEYLVEDLYEDWTMVERERLSNAYIDMLGRLAHYYSERGEHQQSIRACYRVLEKDRCHEESYRLLMRSYSRLGLRGRALRQYRLCERILRQEYGSAPSPETRALCLSLLTEHH
jgi:DNA-binding SARP family transcriptional activator